MAVLARNSARVAVLLLALMVTDDRYLTSIDGEQHILDKPGLLHLENNTTVR